MIFFLRLTKQLLILCLFVSHSSFAHSIDERYDLPLPLHFFLIGSALVVFVSFIGFVFAFTTSKPSPTYQLTIFKDVSQNSIFRCVKICLQLFSLILFFVVLGACFWGDPNPLQNLAPNFIWMTWWLGLSLLISFFGNIWPLLNPWRTLYQLVAKFSVPLNQSAKLSKIQLQGFNGLYLATLFLCLWSWLEVVYPVAFVPYRIGYLILAWSFIQFSGLLLLSPSCWFKSVDFFSIYFEWLGKFGLFSYQQDGDRLIIQPWGFGLINPSSQAIQNGLAGFLIAMLTTVLFDGLHGNQIWLIFEGLVAKLLPQAMDINGYFIGSFGLLLTWIFFFLIYQLSCKISRFICPHVLAPNLANELAPSLIPIAIAYLIAHNFSSFMIQVQNIVFLISDPFHMGWDLFHTANFRPNIGLIDASVTWYIAVIAIVIGHVASIWICHLIVLQKTSSKKDVLLLSMPMTFTMILLTMTSLIIIAEPMTNSG